MDVVQDGSGGAGAVGVLGAVYGPQEGVETLTADRNLQCARHSPSGHHQTTTSCRFDLENLIMGFCLLCKNRQCSQSLSEMKCDITPGATSSTGRNGPLKMTAHLGRSEA